MTPTQKISHEDAVAIDTKLAELWGQANDLSRKMAQHKDHLEYLILSREERRLEKFISMDELRERAKAFTDTYAAREIETYFAKYDEAKAERQVTHDTAAPFESIYQADPWSRFYLVQNTNGHIHSSMNCSTCFHDTLFGWLPELSGLTEVEAVEAYGSILCSICYPSAPVEWTNGISKVAQAEKDERTAAKAERDAAKAAKAITNPDGSPLIIESHGYKTEVRTLVTAQRELVACFKNGIYYPNNAQAYYEQAVILANAIGHKTGDMEIEELLTQAEYKAAKIVKKERG